MGLSFHYQGSIAGPELLPALIDEVIDIIKVYDWDYDLFGRTLPEGEFGKEGHDKELYGIVFQPEGCEPVSVTFLSNGKMSGLINFVCWKDSDVPEQSEYLYLACVKTQFSSVETHKVIIDLFRHLNPKYFKDFSLSDEGSYWETGDEALLEKLFNRNLSLINDFASELETRKPTKAESEEEYLERIMSNVKRMNPEA